MRIALCYRCEDRDVDALYPTLVPAGLLCIHGVLLREGFASRVFNFSGRSWREIAQRLAEFEPEVVGVSHFTYNHGSAARLYASAREAAPRALVVGGGAQAAFLDRQVLEQCPSLDAVVRGEGEVPMLELVNRVWSGEDWRGGPSLTFRAGVETIRTPEAPPVSDLDWCYPLNRFDHVEGVRPGEQFPFLVTSRGCPGKCTFCDSPSFWGRRIRFRSTEGVLSEIRYLMRRCGFCYFGFRDDTFSAQRGRLAKICEGLERETPGILWNCQSRIDMVDEDRLLRMKKAGCEQIQFGIESMSPDVQEFLGKRLDPDRVASVLELCRQIGIRSCAYFITGVPGQTPASLRCDVDLFRLHGLQEAIVSPLCYYPGTVLFEKARARGEVTDTIFFSDDPKKLEVRRDREAARLFEKLVGVAARWAGRAGFSREEIAGHLSRSDRCVSALLDWGRFCLQRGDAAEAKQAFEEIGQRWPRHPWAGLGMADWAAACGWEAEARRWRAKATRMARTSLPREHPDELS